MGIGASILIGGGVLRLVEMGALAATPLAGQPPWRLVLLVIGAPGIVWALAILAIREPTRRTEKEDPASVPKSSNTRAATWALVVPIYVVVALASLVDNAVGAWAPSLLIREFARDSAEVGIVLGLLLTAGFGGGVLAGGWLADRAGARGGWTRKLAVCLVSSLLILPVSLLINAGQYNIVLLSVPLYFALSGSVTALGFSAILDVVPNRSRGLAMAISFFLNVAIGAGVGPTAVAFASDHLFGPNVGLGPAITLTVGISYAIAAVTLSGTLWICQPRRSFS
jgi:MFS family permease